MSLIACAGIALTWVWGIAWDTPPLFFRDGFIAEGIGTSCAPNWYATDHR